MVDVEVGPSFFLWCLTGVIIFLSCLVAPFPVLSLEKAVFQWGFFFFPSSESTDVFALPVFLVTSLGYMRQKENPGNSAMLFFLSQGPYPDCFLLPHKDFI